MPIVIYCPDCTAKIRAPEQIIGRHIRCPKCDSEFVAKGDEAPTPSAPPSAPEPPTPSAPVAVPFAPPPPPEEPAKPARSETIRPEPAADVPPPPEEKPASPASVPELVPLPANALADFLLFRTMITPILVQLIFWIGTILCILTGGYLLISAIVEMVSTDKGPVGPFFLQALRGLGLIVFGPLLVRIGCELNILAFRIYDALKEIHAATEKLRRPE
jgi:hypothetical protein